MGSGEEDETGASQDRVLPNKGSLGAVQLLLFLFNECLDLAEGVVVEGEDLCSIEPEDEVEDASSSSSS